MVRILILILLAAFLAGCVTSADPTPTIVKASVLASEIEVIGPIYMGGMLVGSPKSITNGLLERGLRIRPHCPLLARARAPPLQAKAPLV